MRIVLQKVSRASVTAVEGGIITGQIEKGLCLLIGINRNDTMVEAERLVKKVMKLRLWSEGEKHWCKNITEVEGSILAVSQFTLYANTEKGSKPDFHNAMKTEQAREMFNSIVDLFRKELGQVERVQIGAFGQLMSVDIVNDGPVTLVLE